MKAHDPEWDGQAAASRGTRAVVDLGALARNVGRVLDRVDGRQVMAVVKADGYGHGSAAAARTAIEAGARWLGVASPMEGVELRRAGIRAPILVITPSFPEAAEIVVEHDLAQAVQDLELCRALARAAARTGRTVDVHIKLDTGMGRMGIRDLDLLIPLYREAAGLGNLRIGGIFSHLACADSADKTHARAQAARWREALARLEAAGLDPGLRHLANSAAVIDMPELGYDLVRLGVAMYGLQPSAHVTDPDLEPVMAFMTRILKIGEFPAGASVGYCAAFVTDRPSRIAVLPVGYADGYSRAFSNRGRVLVRGRRAPVAGRVCMDMTMIDITDIPDAAVGDDVLLFGAWGADRLPAEEAAAWTHTINYELVCAVSDRVPRLYPAPGK